MSWYRKWDGSLDERALGAVLPLIFLLLVLLMIAFGHDSGGSSVNEWEQPPCYEYFCR
jgi:hypothetical protein